MKKINLLSIFLFTTKIIFSQISIIPNVDIEQCPTPSYPTGAGFTYVLTFTDNANKFSIGAKTNVEVSPLSTPYGGDTLKASVIIQFKDQSAGEHKFEIKKGSSIVQTFVFTRIKSIADRTLQSVPSSVNAPICNTSVVGISFTPMRFRKTGSSSSADDWSTNLPVYEYQLPAGWTITGGYIGNSGTPGLVLGTNIVQIQPDPLTTGQIKVRTVNSCDGGVTGIIKQSQWSTVSITGRAALSLTTASGSKNTTVQCSDNTDKTFTVQNGSSATCATYTWNITGRGWQNVATGSVTDFTTTSPSVTLRSTGTKQNPTKNLVVTITSGSSVLKDSVVVNFTYKNADIVPFDFEICTNNKVFTLDSITAGTTVTWTTTGYLSPGSGSGTTATISPYNVDPGETGTLRFNYDDVCILETTDVRLLDVNPIVPGHVRINGASAVALRPYTYLPVNPCSVSLDVYGVGCVSWQKLQGTATNINTYGCGATLEFTAGGTQIIIFQMTGGSGCSATTTLYFVPPNTGPGGGNFRISPNPSSNTVYVDGKDKNKTIKEVRLIDKSGNLKVAKVFSGSSMLEVIQIDNLLPDIYTILIFDGLNWESKQVIKQ